MALVEVCGVSDSNVEDRIIRLWEFQKLIQMLIMLYYAELHYIVDPPSHHTVCILSLTYSFVVNLKCIVNEL